MKQPFKVLRDIVHLITPTAGGTLVAKYATNNARQVYQKEKNPPFSPPGITYPIVWSGLYLAMGIAYMIARTDFTLYTTWFEFLMVCIVFQI